MVNRYDNPAQAQFIDTYAPLPFQQLYTLGKDANARVDKAISDLSGALDKWSDFRSPSLKDMQTWYDETLGKAKPIIDKLSQNIDLLKTPEGRAQINSIINNVDRLKLSTLLQSKEGMEQRMKFNQQLAAAGKFNEMWHNVDFANYDSTKSGIFNDIAPLAYKDIRELADPYYAKLQKGYLYTDGNYDYFGNTRGDIEKVADAHLNDIVNTPEAQKHMEVYKRNTGASDAEAIQWLRNSIVESNIDRTIRPTREVNPFSLITARAAATKKASGEETMPVQFSTKLASTLLSKPGTVKTEDGVTIKYNSKFERAQKTFTPGSKWQKSYVDRVTESGKQLPLNRNKTAKTIWEELSTDIGSQVNFINDAELDKNSIVKGINGSPIYSGNNIFGMMTQEQYVNAKMGVPVNNANWSSARTKFEQDLINNNIPNMGITPTSKVLLENGLPGNESYTQEYKAYIPVDYFLNNKDIYKDYFDTGFFGDDTSEEIIKNEDFQKFVNSLNGKIPNYNGRIADIKSVRIADDGTFAPGHETQYNGVYIEIPVMKGVLNNEQTRERANLEEFQYSKLGSKGNINYRQSNEDLIYGEN